MSTHASCKELDKQVKYSVTVHNTPLANNDIMLAYV